MSFVKTNKQNNMQGRVGSSYGERRALQQSPGARTLQRAPIQKPVDNFNGSAAAKRGNVDNFAANAMFRKSAPVNSPATPYKRSMHELVENGRAPRVLAEDAVKQPPSNKALLNFLDKVIAAIPDRTPARSNVSVNSKPLAKVEPRAQKAASAVKPALPRSGRPIPTLSKNSTNRA